MLEVRGRITCTYPGLRCFLLDDTGLYERCREVLYRVHVPQNLDWGVVDALHQKRVILEIEQGNIIPGTKCVNKYNAELVSIKEGKKNLIS